MWFVRCKAESAVGVKLSGLIPFIDLTVIDNFIFGSVVRESFFGPPEMKVLMPMLI